MLTMDVVKLVGTFVLVRICFPLQSTFDGFFEPSSKFVRFAINDFNVLLYEGSMLRGFSCQSHETARVAVNCY